MLSLSSFRVVVLVETFAIREATHWNGGKNVALSFPKFRLYFLPTYFLQLLLLLHFALDTRQHALDNTHTHTLHPLSLGPYKINGVPLRRINQAYVIATTTKVDVSGVNTTSVSDALFKKVETEEKKSGDFLETAEKKVSSCVELFV